MAKINAKILTIGIIGGTAAVGGGIATYYLLKTRKNESNKYIEYVWKEKNIVDNSTHQVGDAKGPILRVAGNKETNNFWFSDQETTKLITKIKNELGYGPEFYKLRSITLGDENVIGEESNGVYFPALDQIFINLDNYKARINKARVRGDLPTSSELSDLKVNLVFETIFHEYGHHIANSYLNSEDGGQRDMAIYSNGKLQYWNKYFTNKFKTYLNYQNWEGEKYSSNIQMYENTNNEFISYKSIGSIYSQQDLFNYANRKNTYDYHELDNQGLDSNGRRIQVYFAGDKKFYYNFNGVDKENLPYLYSMDELFTRKYQQLNEIYHPINKNRWTTLGLSTKRDGKLSDYIAPSDILNNATLYQSSLGYAKELPNGTDYELGNIEELRAIKNPDKDNVFENNWKNFHKNASTSNRFLYDAPFNNDIYTYHKADGTPFVLQDHHKDLYDLMDDFLGHSNGSDISILWNKNSLKTKDGKYISTPSADSVNDANNLLKFGGYVNSNDYESVGYMDNGTFVKLSDITISNFTYKHKDWLGAKTSVALDVNKENKFYTTNDFINKANLLNKNLFFKKSDGSTEPLRTVRNSVQTGTNSNFYPRFFGAFRTAGHLIENRYTFVNEGQNVVLKLQQGGN